MADVNNIAINVWFKLPFWQLFCFLNISLTVSYWVEIFHLSSVVKVQWVGQHLAFLMYQLHYV